MTLEKAEASEGMAPSTGARRNCASVSEGAEVKLTAVEQTKSEGLRLMEAVVERGNMRLAYERVVSNRGAGGVDEMTTGELKGYLKMHWPTIRARLLTGRILPAGGAQGGDSQAARRDEDFGDTDGGGSTDTAGAQSSAARAV